MLSDRFASLMPTGAVRALRGLLARDGTVTANDLRATYRRCARLCGPLATFRSRVRVQDEGTMGARTRVNNCSFFVCS